MLEGWLAELSNRGRWGADDELGTLNLIGPEQRRAAAACVVDGEAVSLALDLVTSVQEGDVHGAPHRHLVRSGRSSPPPEVDPTRLTRFGERYDACAEYVGLVFHGPNVTHLDALAHTVFDGRLHNGAPVSTVSVERGADVHAVTVAANGIVTRGVLLDAAPPDGWLEPGTGVRAADLDRLADAAGVEVQPGDAVLLRTGYGHQRRVEGARPVVPRAGWHPDCLPWFREHDVALVGSDGFNEALPNPYEQVRMPVHIVGQVAIGLWLLDNLDLEEAAAVARAAGRATFQLVVAPLRLPGGTGSPVNPVAVF